MNDTSTPVGWRWWQLTDDGRLSGFHTPYARQPWPRQSYVTAVCNHGRTDHGPHDAPWPDCECGIRVMPNLSHLLDGIRKHPARTGITPQAWRVIGGTAYHADRAHHGVLYVPDVIGQVVTAGRIEDACPWDDPPGTFRAQRASVGAVLHLSAHLARLAPTVARWYPHAAVCVGQTTGLAWLDEISSDHSDHQGGEVSASPP
ncbi:hypothetical protein HUT19_22725 [Streptomyces sp. NA02950]|uniref:hypothetical protein n=1 Tax=Streptomyces sp. NA02950 TaxID=2742137 RepID=UPI001592573D|nr:hypothetical protein [Streptomyces sp. NA02950]QKV94225.1 hypothetical protein HUT19_22725 [Streptomyces sp. NA02950]